MNGSEPEPTPESRDPCAFGATHWSVVLAAGRAGSAGASRALEELCAVYWAPIFEYVRRRGRSREDAEDLTQEFLSRLVERNFLGGLDPARGKFRAFLLASVNHFLANERRNELSLKRGGGRRRVPLRQGAYEKDVRGIEPSHDLTPERVFERRWALTLLDTAMAALREEFAGEGKADVFERLRPFLQGDGATSSYSDAAGALEKTVGAVKVAVHRLRKRYGEILRSEVLKTVASPEEVDDELQHLFAALRPE